MWNRSDTSVYKQKLPWQGESITKTKIPMRTTVLWTSISIGWLYPNGTPSGYVLALGPQILGSVTRNLQLQEPIEWFWRDLACSASYGQNNFKHISKGAKRINQSNNSANCKNWYRWNTLITNKKKLWNARWNDANNYLNGSFLHESNERKM